jgi:hypothetical protein
VVLWKQARVLGLGRACKIQAWVGLYTACLGFCRPGLVCGLGVWTAGLARKPGLRRLRILVYVVKAHARLGLGPTLAVFPMAQWSSPPPEK